MKLKYGMQPGRVHLNPNTFEKKEKNTTKLLVLNATEYDILFPEFKLSANIYSHTDIPTNNIVMLITIS